MPGVQFSAENQVASEHIRKKKKEVSLYLTLGTINHASFWFIHIKITYDVRVNVILSDSSTHNVIIYQNR